MERIISVISGSINAKKQIIENKALLETILKLVEETVLAFKNDKKILFCGNGGSAADAQHLAAELSGRFYFYREPLFAEALHVFPKYILFNGGGQ